MCVRAPKLLFIRKECLNLENAVSAVSGSWLRGRIAPARELSVKATAGFAPKQAPTALPFNVEVKEINSDFSS
jgi:hypothetical protein